VPTDFHRTPANSSAAPGWVGDPFPTNHANTQMLPCLWTCGNSSISMCHSHTTAGKYGPFSPVLWWCLPGLSGTTLRSPEFPLSLGLCAMSVVVKCSLTAPRTLPWIRWGAAVTLPGAPVAWPRWGTRAGIISYPPTASEHTSPGS